MIDKLKLKFGSSANSSPLEFEVAPITIFVGPNNSGKSKTLREIESYCKDDYGQRQHHIILSLIDFQPYTSSEIEKELLEFEQTTTAQEINQPGHIIIGKPSLNDNQPRRFSVHKNTLINAAQHPSNGYNDYRFFLSVNTLRLDGTNRLNLLQQRPAGDLQKRSLNYLSHLFNNEDLRKEVRRIVFDAFGKYFVIDPTDIGNLRVRLSDRQPNSESEEKGWTNVSVKFHNEALEILHASDGIRAFSGIITILLAGDPKILLLDEPEAFLHPALSNQLGKEIGKHLQNTRKRLFASTHSPNFLMGCIQSGSPMNIVRLTYKNNNPTARLLSKEKILKLMRHPMLRSTGVLNALFFESVIVCEGDSDRAFYQEINERLLLQNDDRGIKNCLFINAQNKQTVWQIIKPLREIGIPSIAIVDIDFLKDGGQVFNKLLEGAFIPPLNHHSLQNQRASILNLFNSIGRNMKREGGIDILNGSDKEACDNFFEQLKEYGVFVVKKGELESWLKELHATGEKTFWLINIFTAMGENPDLPTYIKPTIGDVWDFLGEIKTWVDDPNRKGIPE